MSIGPLTKESNQSKTSPSVCPLPSLPFPPLFSPLTPPPPKKLDDMFIIQKRLFAEVKIDSLMHGNITPEEASEFGKQIESCFKKSVPLPEVSFLSSFFFLSSFLLLLSSFFFPP